jgi:hypothetical protein
VSPQHTMKLAELSQEELLARCAWCHQRIPQGHECFGAGLRVRPERRAEIVVHEGRAVPLQLVTGREIIVMVTAPDSQARAAGDDLYFQTCSAKCSKEADDATRDEIGL